MSPYHVFIYFKKLLVCHSGSQFIKMIPCTTSFFELIYLKITKNNVEVLATTVSYKSSHFFLPQSAKPIF